MPDFWGLCQQIIMSLDTHFPNTRSDILAVFYIGIKILSVENGCKFTEAPKFDIYKSFQIQHFDRLSLLLLLLWHGRQTTLLTMDLNSNIFCQLWKT